jgi:hypothetical protein
MSRNIRGAVGGGVSYTLRPEFMQRKPTEELISHELIARWEQAGKDVNKEAEEWNCSTPLLSNGK